LRFSLLRVRHGFGAIVQRRGRHLDADDHQSLRVLVVGIAAGLRAGDCVGHGTTRSLHRDHDRLFNSGSCQWPGFSAWSLEDKGSVKTSSNAYCLVLSECLLPTLTAFRHLLSKKN